MSSILNEKATRGFILRMAERHRPGWKFTRVSKVALYHVELYTKAMIIKQIQRHRAVGTTITFE